MKGSQRKDFFREIRKSMGRYLSILFIVALGVAFYAGVRSAEPDMRQSADQYFDETNLMDIRILGTLGLTEDDLEEIRKIDGVTGAEGGYSAEFLTYDEDKKLVVNVMSLADDINRKMCIRDSDYLFGARAVLPIPERAGEEGVALSPPLTREEYGRTDMNSAEIAYRWPPALAADETFDLGKLYTEGDISYVYTEAACDHVLKYEGCVEHILINGSYAADELCADTGSVRVKTGDRLLFRCRRSADGWKLRLKTERLCLPFLTSIRGTGDRAVCIGPFFGTQCHGPEYDWDLSKVFVNQKGRRIYWRFCDGSELRIYLDSVFFGQWFYALMVGFYGIRDAAILSGRTDGQRLFCENMSALAKYFDYIEYDIQQHVMPAFMPRLYDMSVLDNIGTMGMNLADAYLDCNDRALLPLIERIRHQACLLYTSTGLLPISYPLSARGFAGRMRSSADFLQNQKKTAAVSGL